LAKAVSRTFAGLETQLATRLDLVHTDGTLMTQLALNLVGLMGGIAIEGSPYMEDIV
jgi:hypothetical protein